jgi:hypothetical protein
MWSEAAHLGYLHWLPPTPRGGGHGRPRFSDGGVSENPGRPGPPPVGVGGSQWGSPKESLLTQEIPTFIRVRIYFYYTIFSKVNVNNTLEENKLEFD